MQNFKNSYLNILECFADTGMYLVTYSGINIKKVI